MPKIEVDKAFLYDLFESLQNMIQYADDGMLDRRDPDFKVFFDDVDTAYANLKQLDSILEGENDEGDEEDVGQIPLF